MDIFEFSLPTRVFFGKGARHGLPGALSSGGVLFVVSPTVRRTPLFAGMLQALSGFEVFVYDEIKPNPREEDIERCVAAYAGKNIMNIVGLGGGSAMDQAKATAASLSSGRSVGSLIEAGEFREKRRNTLVLMPTTSGTGSELSYAAVITRAVTGEKVGLRGREMAADIAIADPEFTYDLPASVTRDSGFDALAHAVETLVSRKASPYTEHLSREALCRIFVNLPKVLENPDDLDARDALSYASTLMGANLALAGTCLPHRLQYPVGAATGTSHARGLAAVYPAWLKAARRAAEEKFARGAEWLGVCRDFPVSVRAGMFMEALLSFRERVGLGVTLGDLGIAREDVEALADNVSGNLGNDPCYASRDDIVTIYSGSF